MESVVASNLLVRFKKEIKWHATFCAYSEVSIDFPNSSDTVLILFRPFIMLGAHY